MNTRIRILTLWNPWAHFMRLGIKTIETRSWKTSYRGPVLLHAARKWDKELATIYEKLVVDFPETNPHNIYDPQDNPRITLARNPQMDFGAVVAVAYLSGLSTGMQTEKAFNTHPIDLALGDYSAYRWAWKFEDIRPLEKPVRFQGSQGFRWIDLDEHPALFLAYTTACTPHTDSDLLTLKEDSHANTDPA